MMMPAEQIGGVTFPEWDASQWAQEFAATDWKKVAADMKPIIDRLKAMGALEPDFEL
ncbi:hypothetical protein [Paracoccus contaminans]|nr:hypothetical protein [Paracoccus contaminans]